MILLTVQAKGIVFGSPDSTDRTRQWFTPRTNYHDLHKAVFHNHNSKDLLGHVVSMQREGDGYNFLLSVFLTPEYYFIRDEFRKGKVYVSSGTGSHLAEISETGEIIQWPIAEISLVTPYAQNPEHRSIPADWRSKAKLLNHWYGTVIEYEQVI